MLLLEVVEIGTDKVLERFPVSVDDPEILFVKDRQTKRRYVMIRKKGSDPYSKKQLFETKYDQYSPVHFKLVTLP